ncbi:MFS general substrate transporter [Ceraceosorus guamensis]|uniref:MFS general substrate transporter n=1 Tax=Ceraceosorus guamensis TaxID=1522189 RepID=A0A316W711_9BASI|nr:MFS general substrate transporter [Ceraceosorus guamensis]PWN43873.1 MFS general substrate transporter [Ceraceosorus guamensis]
MSLARIKRFPNIALRNVLILFQRPAQTQAEDESRDASLKARNPITILASLTFQQWGFYTVAWGGWIFDSYDFNVLAIQTTKLSRYYHVDKTRIADAITFTLLFRLIGALIFGIVGDYYGRKWPFAINMWLLGILQIATVYAESYGTFVAVRSLFGVAMGGVFGGACAMALENMPIEARGLLGGVFQEGYSVGYIIAAVGNLIVGGATNSWKSLFWFGAGGSFLFGTLRLALPESRQFLEARSAGRGGQSTRDFGKDTVAMLKAHWPVAIYCGVSSAISHFARQHRIRSEVMSRDFIQIFMTIVNFWGHTCADSYTTFMLAGNQLKNGPASRASIWMKTGALFGGTVMGYCSQWLGRRRAIVLSALVCGLMIPAWILPDTVAGLVAGGFFLQFFLGGAVGIVPAHLQELSPPQFRAVFVGMAYQLGNAIASPATQIVSDLAEHHFKSTGPDGRSVDGYGPVMGVATAIFASLMVLWTSIGPENAGSHFERARVAGAIGVSKELPSYESDPSNTPAVEAQHADILIPVQPAAQDGSEGSSRE